MSHDPQLAQAVNIWRGGKTIPVTLWATLSARGYDMYRLENRHLDN
jgi:hypothetical protein